jgi:hypothetical protein
MGLIVHFSKRYAPPDITAKTTIKTYSPANAGAEALAIACSFYGTEDKRRDRK